MPIGRVVKNYNGYYYVDTGTGELTECRRRGKIKEKSLWAISWSLRPLMQVKELLKNSSSLQSSETTDNRQYRCYGDCHGRRFAGSE